MRLPKLIPGKMNFPYIKCKPGYAENSKPVKPRIEKREEKPLVTKLRKKESLMV